MPRTAPPVAIIEVRVVPRAGRTGMAGVRGDALLVRLHSAPVDGAANRELVQLIADALDVPRRAVTIVTGERSRTKRVRVEGLVTETAVARLKRDGPG